MSSFHTRRR